MADISFLNDGGEMGERMRAHDWSTSSLGPPGGWSQPLRTAVRLLLNSGHPMYIFWGADGACLYNDAYRQSIGPERHPGSLGRPAREVWHEIWEIIGPQIEQVMAGDGATWHENHLVPITRHGRREDVYWTYSFGPIDDGTAPNTVGGVLVVCTETTQAVLSQQQQVLESEARLRAIFQTSYQYQGLLTVDGVMVDANPVSLEGIGAQLEEVVGRPFWETPWFAGTPGMVEAVRDAVPLVAGGETVRREIHVNLPVGGWRWFDFTMRPLRDPSGTVIAIVPEAVELTQRRHAEEALRQAHKMEAIGQLTGGIAHDFNNLLTGITGSLDLVRRRLASGRTDGLERFMGAASASALRAAALTHRLLAFSRRQSLDTKPQQVNAIIAGMDDMLRRSLGESVEVATVLAPDLWTAMTDANQLESALLNLAINARDAMPGGGRLTIETANRRLADGHAHLTDDMPAGDYVEISVSDTGTGMSPEVIARAFEPFFTTKVIGEGTGLGLSMIYGFAKQSGGNARIESQVGAGTTIRLVLRRALSEDELDAAEPMSQPPQGRGETVLVVEDDATVRLLITEVLEELDYRYIEAADARAAIAIVESDRPINLIVTDVGLPHMNGRQFAEIARQRRPSLKVLFITGYDEAAARGSSLAPGMDLMTKPFALDALAAKIRELIES